MLQLVAKVLLFAAILSGECGPIQGACRTGVAQTIANRGLITSGYFARSKPDNLDYNLAYGLATGRIRGNGGYVFAYSERDRWRMGWRRGDWRVCGPAGLCVNFTKEWPGW